MWDVSGRDIGKAYLSEPEKSRANIPGHSPLLQIQVPRRQMLGNISQQVRQQYMNSNLLLQIFPK